MDNTCLLAIVIGAICLAVPSYAAFKRENCEACVNFFEAFQADVKDLDDSLRNDNEAMIGILSEFCKKQTSKQDKDICYNIGGLEISASSIMKDVVKMYFYPATKICEKLSKKDPQICEIKIKKKRDFVNLDLKKLRVKELKNILNDWDRGDACKGCAEKSDYVQKVLELMPKYEPAAWKARLAKQEL